MTTTSIPIAIPTPIFIPPFYTRILSMPTVWVLRISADKDKIREMILEVSPSFWVFKVSILDLLTIEF